MRLWYHGESDCLFTTEDEEEDPRGDGSSMDAALVDELEPYQWLKVLFEQHPDLEDLL